MATEFELLIAQPEVDAAYARQVADAVFAEVDRLEDDLSRYKPGSDIWRINHLRAGEQCRIGMAARDCLQLAFAVHAETGGAFDITIGRLMDIFRHNDGTPRTPSAQELEEARQRIGPHIVSLDDSGMLSATVDLPALDLGALGKGYALDQAVTVLHDHGIHHALLNAGSSTVLGLGHPPDAEGWTVHAGNAAPVPVLLHNSSLSASGFVPVKRRSCARWNRVLIWAPAGFASIWSVSFMLDEASTAMTTRPSWRVVVTCLSTGPASASTIRNTASERMTAGKRTQGSARIRISLR